ncbi:MAG: prolyl oligopeptidase family serine peptidase [Leadbetterella sp.]
MKKILAFVLLPLWITAQYSYPPSKTVDQKDIYHGEEITDPYRWLEDDNSDETKKWVDSQIDFTNTYLSKIPFRDAFKKRLKEVSNYPRYSSPFENKGWYYFYKNNGLQNQSVLYRQKGLKAEPEVVLDPNTFSTDGTTRLTQFSVSKDGKFAAFCLSKGGSDWQEISVMDLKTKIVRAQKVEWVKFTALAWYKNGFFYSRYPKPEGSKLASKNTFHQIWYHSIGKSTDTDSLIFIDKDNPERFHYMRMSEDEKYGFLSVSDRGKGMNGNALYLYLPAKKEFLPILPTITNFTYSVISNDDDRVFIETNENAPNGKVMEYSIASQKWKTLIAEKKYAMNSVSSCGKQLFVNYLRDVVSDVQFYNYNGDSLGTLSSPGLGAISGFGGKSTDKQTFYSFNSFTEPPTIYLYTLKNKQSIVFRRSDVKFDQSLYTTQRVFYTSKDGTQVPLFITHKKDVVLNGTNPTLLYGYGGFSVNLTPSFSSQLIPFLEQGGVYAQANLRGGFEYGESWHQQGMKLKKQNVFDDFIAAGEYLIREKYCTSDYLALRGRSNGGLLVGAVINQRPDLAKVAFPQVGVMDMLRFQKFTIGWNWIADYGSSDNYEEFKALRSYSPLHNIKANTSYPATFVTTADHDDRVVPAHSFKYAANLQNLAGEHSKNPLLIHISKNSGHGQSNISSELDLTAEIYSFLFYSMHIKPKF